MPEQRRIHRDRRREQRGEEHSEPRRLRDPPHADAGARDCGGASGGDGEGDPHRAERDRCAGEPRDDRRRRAAGDRGCRRGGPPRIVARQPPDERRQAQDRDDRPDDGRVQHHERELESDARGAQRVQREVQQVEIRVGDDEAEEHHVPLVALERVGIAANQTAALHFFGADGGKKF